MILVTGAAGVLGQAVIATLSAHSQAVAAVDLAPTIPQAGQRLSFGGIDLADPAAGAALIAQVGEPVTGLVNVAGGFVWETVGEGGWASWERMYRINVQTAFEASRLALPALRASRGAIVNVSAAATARAGAGMGAYTAAKSAVSRLTEALAAEELTNGVRVNAVMPSVIDTPANRRDMPDADPSRWVTPTEIAEVVAFLLSPAASGVTGALVPVVGRVG
ncbi:MAG: SDR family oxidoreductase [Gammaproteobacteria bacterium]|nr:SDR family oxidoreductase [Gammaproteobacteria bacterium]